MEKEKNSEKPEKVTKEKLDNLVSDVVQLLLKKKITIATAESCTGGLISELITSVPGASKIFEIGVCTYSNKIKHEYLGVPKALFKEYGAVSRQVALAMVAGLQERSGADICISVTGTAGPGGGTPEKPVGTVYVGISSGRKRIVKLLKLWQLEDKSRDNIRINAAYRIFVFLKKMVSAMPDDLPDGDVPDSKGTQVAKNLLPWKGDSRSQMLRKLTFLGSAVAFTICLFFVVDYYWGNYKNQKLGENLQQLYSQAEDIKLPQTPDAAEEPTEKVWELKDGARALLERNEDTVGYISIPDTDISYPVVQRRQEDGNDFYIEHNIDKEKADAGSIFLDWRNNFDYVVDGTRVFENSGNLVIYGHEMKDRSMFGSLSDYMDVDGYYSAHPLIMLSSNYEDYVYKIFAYFMVDAEDQTETRYDYWNKLDFTDEKDFYDFVNGAKKRAFTFNDVDVRYGDQLLTLQTCHSMFSTARFVVMARLVRKDEDPYEGTQNVTENDNILRPSIYYEWYSGEYDPDADFRSYPYDSSESSESSKDDEDEDEDDE